MVVTESTIETFDVTTGAVIKNYGLNAGTHHYRYIAEAVPLGQYIVFDTLSWLGFRMSKYSYGSNTLADGPLFSINFYPTCSTPILSTNLIAFGFRTDSPFFKVTDHTNLTEMGEFGTNTFSISNPVFASTRIYTYD